MCAAVTEVPRQRALDGHSRCDRSAVWFLLEPGYARMGSARSSRFFGVISAGIVWACTR